jgi:hypothetical protein
MKLYRAHSMVNHPDEGEICYNWYISDRPIYFERPYRDLIEDYNKIACNDVYYIEDMVNEFFDADELKDLQAFLQESFNTELVSEEVTLPIPREEQNVMPYCGVPAGGGPNHYLLHKHSIYNLPFKVVGYFDTRSTVNNQ